MKNPYLWAIVIRVICAVTIPRSLQGDSIDYEQLATNLANGHGFSRCFSEPFNPTAQRPPLYPLVLGFFYIIGLSHNWGPIFLNLVFDLISMRFARSWAQGLKLSWARKVPWVVGLCPLLITYGMYATTENLSILLFFLATHLFFQKRVVASGLMWGLLSLCRSYYLLFPIVLFLTSRKLKLARGLSLRDMAIITVLSFAAPSVWMVRNYIAIDRIAFTQTSMVGWQSYQGICVANFDWWRPEHLAHMYATPVLAKMIAGHCAKEEETAALDKEVTQMVWQCIKDRPYESARNVLTKGVLLFVNWGLFMPYNRVPFVVQQAVNAFMCFLWLCMGIVLWRNRQRVMSSHGVGECARFSLLNIVYIVAVTVPFAVDARYLLGPFLTLLVACLELAKTPKGLLGAALPDAPDSSDSKEAT